MKQQITALFFLLTSAALCQVEIDGPVVLSGPEAMRRVDGLAAPLTGDAALTVEGSLLGTANWAEASLNGTAIALSSTVPLIGYRDGLLLRFIAPASAHDSLFLSVDGLPPFPLVRPDGIGPVRGQVRTGALCEVLFANERWILMNAPELGCPVGTTRLHERLCMETTGMDNMLFFGASERCADMGGRLCNWGEFHWACTQFASELTGMTDSWEWVDEGANHAHSTVNVGFGNCNAERSSTPPITFARSRCCFDPR